MLEAEQHIASMLTLVSHFKHLFVHPYQPESYGKCISISSLRVPEIEQPLSIVTL